MNALSTKVVGIVPVSELERQYPQHEYQPLINQIKKREAYISKCLAELDVQPPNDEDEINLDTSEFLNG